MLCAPAKLVQIYKWRRKKGYWICPQKPFNFAGELVCSGVLSTQNYGICYKWQNAGMSALRAHRFCKALVNNEERFCLCYGFVAECFLI